jgi:hypothetical protein
MCLDPMSSVPFRLICRRLGVSSVWVGSELCGGVPWGDAGRRRAETRPCAPMRSRNTGLSRDEGGLPPSPCLHPPSARLPTPAAGSPPHSRHRQATVVRAEPR